MNIIDGSADAAAAALDTPVRRRSRLAAAARIESPAASGRPRHPSGRSAASPTELSALARPTVHLLEPLGDVTVVSLELIRTDLKRILLPEAQAAGIRPGDRLNFAFDPGKCICSVVTTGAALR